MRSHRTLIALLILLSLALTACVAPAAPAQPAGEAAAPDATAAPAEEGAEAEMAGDTVLAPLDPPEKVTVAYVPIMKFATMYVAEARGLFGRHPHPGEGVEFLHQYPNPRLLPGAEPTGVPRPAPGLGQHTRAVLTEFGAPPEQIDAAFAARAAAEPG